MVLSRDEMRGFVLSEEATKEGKCTTRIAQSFRTLVNSNGTMSPLCGIRVRAPDYVQFTSALYIEYNFGSEAKISKASIAVWLQYLLLVTAIFVNYIITLRY